MRLIGPALLSHNYDAVSGSMCMRTTANRYFRYSDNIKRAVAAFAHHGLLFMFSETTGNGMSVNSGPWCSSSAMARGICQLDVTTISELKRCSFAQRLASMALPTVLSAERSRSTQQANRRA